MTEPDFGPGTISRADWEFITATMDYLGVKYVVEIGAGYSTILFSSLDIRLVSYETRSEWIMFVQNIDPKIDIRSWTGVSFPPDWKSLKKPDLVFIDGPAGGENREWAFALAAAITDAVIVHDSTRNWEKKWSRKYLAPSFDLKRSGGDRCAWWQRRP